MSIEVEKIADDRYRLRAHDHTITLSARDLCDMFDWLRDGTRLYHLQAEARAAAEAVARKKPWLPVQPGEEF